MLRSLVGSEMCIRDSRCIQLSSCSPTAEFADPSASVTTNNLKLPTVMYPRTGLLCPVHQFSLKSTTARSARRFCGKTYTSCHVLLSCTIICTVSPANKMMMMTWAEKVRINNGWVDYTALNCCSSSPLSLTSAG